MGDPIKAVGTLRDTVAEPNVHGRLFRKYAAIFVAVVSISLIANGAFEIWFSYREQRNLLFRLQHEQAEAVAASITEFIKAIQDQMAWSTLLPWDTSTFKDWRFDAVRLLREAPAVSEVAQLDASGHELFRVSRQAMDVVANHQNDAHDPFFVEAMAHKVYYGPVYFVGGSEPFMTLAMAGDRPEYGVIEAQVNLKFIWDVVSKVKVGQRGYAYVVDDQGRLIAHPDISLVLRNVDMSSQPQVRAARKAASAAYGGSLSSVETDNGSVLSASAIVTPLNWLVFVELPSREAFASIYSSVLRSGALLLASLALALLAGLVLARRMVVPIRVLHDGAARVGSGDLSHRISITTGDELQALGDQFNAMANRLQESYATLEGKVEERTRQLEAANLAKSRFLAAASHDLRQPLHAIGLFVALLRERQRASERKVIISRIESALAAMNDLFSALLDISKLDAGALTPNVTDFPVARLLAHVETTFGEAARNSDLSLRVVHSSVRIRSDFILLERVIFNLVANAVRYTRRGGIVVGCRRRNDRVRIEVWDSGIGIPADQHEKIFGEFYRLPGPENERRAGLGLGLAIVERLCRLLDHPLEVRSVPDRGSIFAVTVPLASTAVERPLPGQPARHSTDSSRGKLVLVIDDDPFALEGMDGILRSWGCDVVTADTEVKALKALAKKSHLPDLIISDYRLSSGRTGLEAIERVRIALSAQIPAFLVSGDINSEPTGAAKAKGLHVLHKPVNPMALRAMFQHALNTQSPSRQPQNVGQD